MNLNIKIGNKTFKNPVFTASGTSGYGEEYNNLFDLNILGAFITKGITITKRDGNDGLRIFETPSGIINRIGLQNVGINEFIKEKLPFLINKNVSIIVNIAGFSIEEFIKMIEILDSIKEIKAIEINVSCPNVKKGGIFFSSDKTLFTKLLKNIRKKTNKLLIIKLSPSEGNLKEFAKIVEVEGGDAVTISNTFKAAVVDTKLKTIKIKGGLSGAAIYPIVLNNIIELYKFIDIPIIASGGIYNPNIALQFLLAGAKAVEIGSAAFKNPFIFIKTIEYIKNYLIDNKISDINDLIGAVHNE